MSEGEDKGSERIDSGAGHGPDDQIHLTANSQEVVPDDWAPSLNSCIHGLPSVTGACEH